jgi:hypothetical protein
MQDTIRQHLAALGDTRERLALNAILSAIGDRLSTQSLNSAGLAIKAGSSAVVKLGATDYYASVKGMLVLKAASTDMAALVGTVTADLFNVYCFFIDSAGTLTTAMGTEGATLAAVKFPVVPENKAMIGLVIINPTGTGNFVGGTTALDDGTVVPNAVYINTVGAFDPSVII